MDVKKVLDSGRTRISVFSINLSAHRKLLLVVIRPSPEYVWEKEDMGMS